MAARSTRIGGRNPEQAGQAAWLATEKVVRPSTRPERHSAFPAFRSCASSARFASFSSDASRAPCPLSSTPQNAELFTLTYGAIVRQVLHDYEDCVEEANKKLDAMGHSIGCRLVEDFLAKTNVQRCGDFRDVVDAVAKVGLRMFLGVSARAEGWNEDETECRVVLESNPLADSSSSRSDTGTSATARCSAASCAAPWRRSVDGASATSPRTPSEETTVSNSDCDTSR